jgi:hypothetical protein
VARMTVLVMQESDHATLPKQLVFRWTVHHVTELFLATLGRKYVLDASSKVQITCGPRGEQPRYWQALGCSELFVEDFDFDRYVALTPEARECHALSTLHGALSEVARRAAAEVTPLDDARDAVLACRFAMEIPIARLSRRVPGTRRRVVIVRRLSREVGESWIARQVDHDGRIVASRAMTKEPDFLDRTDVFKRSEMKGRTFVVKDRLGKETFRWPLGKELAQPT